MNIEISFVVFTLLGMIVLFLFLLFWSQIWQIFMNKFGVKVKNLFYFQDNYLLLFVYFLGIVAAIVYVYLQGKWEDIKKLVNYYFKEEKFLVSGTIIEIIEIEYNVPLFLSGTDENFNTINYPTTATDFSIIIQRDDGANIRIELKIDKESFKKMNLIKGGLITNLPVRKHQFEDLFSFKSIIAL